MVSRIYEFTTNLSVLSTTIPLILIILIRNNTFNIQLKVLFFYLTSSFLIDVLSFLHFFSDNNSFLINSFTLIEFLSILIIFESQWMSKKMSQFLYALGLLFVIYFILVILYIPDLNLRYVWINVFKGIIIITLSVLYFFTLLNDLSISKLTLYYLFWLNTAFVIYFSVVLFIFLFMNYILDPNASQPVKNLWLLHNLFHILYNILLAIGIFQWKKALK